jgi:hypothetical protein
MKFVDILQEVKAEKGKPLLNGTGSLIGRLEPLYIIIRVTT